jgi:hypothetical protein
MLARSALTRLLPASRQADRSATRKVVMKEGTPVGFEALRKQAKRWLAALRAGDAEAYARLARALPHHGAPPVLREVQQALAREHGFGSWAQLEEHHQLSALEQQGRAALVDELLQSACIFSARAALRSTVEGGRSSRPRPTMRARCAARRPVILRRMEQGIEEGDFTVDYPLETAEMVLAMTFSLSDAIAAHLMEARMETKIALESLLARSPDLRLAVPAKDLVVGSVPLLHTYESLPVELT